MGWKAGIRFLSGAKVPFTPQRPDRLQGPPTQTPTQWVPGALPSRVKRSGREANEPPPSSPEVEHCGAIPPLLSMYSWRGI
jgi:hypothetical protein